MGSGINDIEIKLEMGSPVPSITHNNAVAHLNGVAMFARKLHQLEKERDLEAPMADYSEARSFTDAAIIMAGAAIEANLNEVLDEISASDDVWVALRKEEGDLRRKHNAALVAAGLEPLNLGSSPCQEVKVLIKIRNRLIHATPLTRDIGGEHPEEVLETMLKEQGFDLYPGLPDSEPIFPRRYCSHGCAEWAARSASSFIRAFNEIAHPDRNELNVWSPSTL